MYLGSEGARVPHPACPITVPSYPRASSVSVCVRVCVSLSLALSLSFSPRDGSNQMRKFTPSQAAAATSKMSVDMTVEL